jgi:hypothetical protein
VSAGAAAQAESERSRARAEEHRRRAEAAEVRARKFEMGLEGELRVSGALKRLEPAGYVVIDDIRWPGTLKGNIDHVVFGPTGMFVVDAKNWTGKVEVRSGVLRQNGYGRTRETDKVASMTADLQAHLGASVGSLRGVICLAGQPDQRPTYCGSTLVVGVDQLSAWIFRQPEVWPATHVAAVANWIPHVIESALAASDRPTRDVQPRGRHQAD